MKYSYYPGCSMHSTAAEFESSFRFVAGILGMELTEVEDWFCCGATPAHITNPWLGLALPTQNLLQARPAGLDVATTCAACYNRLKTANRVALEKPKKREALAQILGEEYKGEIPVRHILDIFVNDVGMDTIHGNVLFPLNGLRVASYYGCLLTRPPEVADFDDVENPVTMDKIIEALGGVALEWPFKTECCGASFSLSRSDIVGRLAGEILRYAKQAGAECIAVACPLCQSNLDLRQKEASEYEGVEFNMPILYITQLMAVAYGGGGKDVGLGKAIVNAESVVHRVFGHRDSERVER